MDKFQQIRVHVDTEKTYRINAETDKGYRRVKGIFVSMPHDYYHVGACLGLKIGQETLFSDEHETKLLTTGNQVAPNNRFFLFDSKVEANGSVVEGRFTTEMYAPMYPPYDMVIYLWLTNDEQE